MVCILAAVFWFRGQVHDSENRLHGHGQRMTVSHAWIVPVRHDSSSDLHSTTFSITSMKLLMTVVIKKPPVIILRELKGSVQWKIRGFIKMASVEYLVVSVAMYFFSLEHAVIVQKLYFRFRSVLAKYSTVIGDLFTIHASNRHISPIIRIPLWCADY